MNQIYHTKIERVKSMRAKTFIYGLILMLGLSLGTLQAQEASEEIKAEAKEVTSSEIFEDQKPAEIFGEKYNAQELEMLNKFSAEQLHQYLMQKEQLELERRNKTDWEEIIIAPLIVGTVFITPVLIVGFLVFFSHRDKQLVHASIAKMVDKGMEIPPHLLIQQKKQKESSPNADLKKALILLSVGLGVSLFLFYIPDAREEGAWSIGVIPFIIGLGYLVFWKLDKPKNEVPRVSPSE